MAKLNVGEEILRFNTGRDPRRLKFKYKAMRSSAFAFLRGTCHLFYQDLPQDAILRKAPAAWISGGLHLENFGSYKGDNRLTYFDLNDFDEACLAPCAWELLRFLSSVLVGASTLKIYERERLTLCQCFLDAYRRNLADGKARWIERRLAQAMVKDLLNELRDRDRGKFLDRRTERSGKNRSIRIDGKKALETPKSKRKQVIDFLKKFAKEQQHPEFYRFLDIADRIAGTGSLGVERYVVLVEGRGSPDENFLLDIKEARPSTPSMCLTVSQPKWTDDAARVVTLQRCMQAIPPALLTPIRIGKKAYVLKELQPSEDRVNLELWNGRLRRLEKVMKSMGELVAWGQLRASGWRDAAIREELSDFGEDTRWVKGLVELAVQRSQLVTKQWQEYARAYDHGVFKQVT